MRVYEGAYYVTQRGRIVGPLRRMQNSMHPQFYFDDEFEAGIWNQYGRCNNPETKTGFSYGDLVCETE